jgi:hypothetical protein
MRKTLVKLALALSVVVGSLGIALPAQAAGVCNRGGVAIAPLALFPGSFILRNNLPTREYKGTPFSFRLKMARGGFPGETTYKWYTYDRGSKRSMETGILAPGKAVLVQTWCGGKRGADWVGSVASK